MGKERLKLLLKLQQVLYETDGLYLEGTKFVQCSTTGVMSKKSLLQKLKSEVEKCKKCQLWKTRVNTVFGEGYEDSEIMFVGEAPGFEEDKQGRPFVGRAGELLTQIINEVGLSRDKVYITNIVKCHPVIKPDPYLRNNDRPPKDEEITACVSYIKKQIEIINPKIICCLGATALKTLTEIVAPLYEVRGKKFSYKDNPSIIIVPTYHPAAVLRNQSLEKLLRKDIQYVVQILKSKHEKK